MKLSRAGKFEKGLFSFDCEKAGFLLLLLVMAVYYGYRMFALTPWYDELYTYYFFISRGPVYAAIHWPVPNNHVGYSVLSAVLAYFGNPYIGLRGVSFLCALANLVLLFQIGRRYLQKGLALATVLFYVSMNLVNQMAVQGRGYTLSVTCFLTAFLCLVQICEKETCKKRYDILFALSLILGLYTLPSDVYWVLPVCLAGGIYLLYEGILKAREGGGLKDNIFIRKLLLLALSALAAAVITVFLYAVIWLAIGSNLLVKEESGIYYGMGHVQMITSAPFKALKTGMDYMLASPYIQSVEKEGFLLRLREWFRVLLNWYMDGLPMAALLLSLAGIACSVMKIVKGMRRKEGEGLLFPLFLFTGSLCMPLFLLIQHALPYHRVFTYGGVLLSLIFGFLAQCFIEFFSMVQNRKKACSATGREPVETSAGEQEERNDKKEKRAAVKKKTIETATATKTEAAAKAAIKVETGIAANAAPIVIPILTLAYAIFCFCFKGYQNQYSMREYEIQDALSHSSIESAEKICVTDCTQQYLIKFLYDKTCEDTQIEGADFLLLDKKMTDPDYQELEWEFYHYYDTIAWDYIYSSMEQIYENESFVLYEKKKGGFL